MTTTPPPSNHPAPRSSNISTSTSVVSSKPRRRRRRRRHFGLTLLMIVMPLAVASIHASTSYLRSLLLLWEEEPLAGGESLWGTHHHQQQQQEQDQSTTRSSRLASPTMSSSHLLPSNNNTNNKNKNYPISICIIVRTYFGQAAELPTLLDSLVLERHRQLAKMTNLTTHVTVVDTMPNTPRHDPQQEQEQQHPYAASFTEWLTELIHRTNARAGRLDAVQWLDSIDFQPKVEYYGYDATNFAMDYLHQQQQKQQQSQPQSQQCTHYMFTNGDNYYLPQLWTELQDLLPTYDLIGWDFITHHPRKHGNMITLDWKRGFVDLGSFVVHAKYLMMDHHDNNHNNHNNNHTNTTTTTSLQHFGYEFAADFHFVNALLPKVPKDKRTEIHQVRMVHN